MSGSATTVRWLLRNGLLDELNLLVHPVVVGDGLARLFTADEAGAPLELRSSETFKSGVLNLSYAPAAAADRGGDEMAARIVVTEFVSLDGVMEAPGGEDFKYPGWTFEFDRGDDGNQFKLDETMRADGLLIGRRTYDSFAGAWPHREGEFADKFNAMPKFVVSTIAGRAGVEQHDGPRERRRDRPGARAQGPDSTASSRSRAATGSSRS